MLREFVTALFCCLPHHHDAPVVERITPITVVSQEPYSDEAYRQAIESRRYEDVASLMMRRAKDKYGQDFLDMMNENCERFAQGRRYLELDFTDNLLVDGDPLYETIKYVCEQVIHVTWVVPSLIAVAREGVDVGLSIKALFWWLVDRTDIITSGEFKDLLSSIREAHHDRSSYSAK